MLHRKLWEKVVSLILSFNLLLQSFVPFLISPVYAIDDATSATIESTAAQTPETTPSPEVTPESTPTPSIIPDTTITPTIRSYPNY